MSEGGKNKGCQLVDTPAERSDTKIAEMFNTNEKYIREAYCLTAGFSA